MSKFGWDLPAGAANDPLAPYNQGCEEMPILDNPLPKHSVICPACGENADWLEEFITDDEFNNEPQFLGWHCEGCDWEQEALDEDWLRLDKFKSDYQPRIEAIQAKLTAGPKQETIPGIDEFFEYFPAGDFTTGDNGILWTDPHCYRCDDDCPARWHTQMLWQEIGRENGDRFVIFHNVDEDGDDYPEAYDERDCNEPGDWEEVYRDCNPPSDQYFRCWAEYWLDCATTLQDPLDQAIRKSPNDPDWTDFCLKSAESLAKHL